MDRTVPALHSLEQLSGGRPVRDLETNDFQVFEDRKQQSILNLSWVEAGRPHSDSRRFPLREYCR